MLTKYRHSLYTKLLVRFVGFIIIPFILSTTLLFSLFEKQLQQRSHETHLNMLKQLESYIVTQTRTMKSIASTISSDGDFINFLSRPYSSKLDFNRYTLSISNFVKGCTQANSNLDVSIYMNNYSIPRGFGIFEHLEPISSHPLIENFLQETIDSKWFNGSDFKNIPKNSSFFNVNHTFVYLEKIWGYDNTLLGIIAITVPQDYLIPNYPIESIEDGYIIFNLTDLSISPNELNSIKNNSKSPLLNKIVTTQYAIEDFPWKLLMITLPNSSPTLFYSISFLFLCLLLLSIYLFTKSLISAIEKVKHCLSDMNDSISHDFKDRLAIVGQDEISSLAKQINHLLDHIEHLVYHNIQQGLSTKEAQITALQNQINPHFIYNTLEIFSNRMECNGCFEESDALTAFANLFRYNINTFDSFVILSEEILHIERYLEIQRLKYSNIEFNQSIPDHLMNCKVIKFLFQPLIENCLKHGMYDPATPLTITLKVYKETSSTLVIEIWDNGKGITPEKLDFLNTYFRQAHPSIKKDGQSIGLTNINSRLQLFYGPEHFLQLSSCVSQFTCVSFKIKITP